MIGLRTTIVILCVAAAAIAAVLSAQASSPAVVRTFDDVNPHGQCLFPVAAEKAVRWCRA
jgi:hypothetical protein